MKSKTLRVAAWGVCLLALPCTAMAQMNMTMPPADLCAGDSSATVVPAGTILAPPAVATYGCLSVHGTLDLSSVRTLTVRTLHQHANGTIRLASDAVSRTIQIADVAPTDMGQFGTGLIMEGRIEIEGAAKTSWTRLTAELLAGQSTIAVVDTAGWQVGDQLVVADSRDLPSSTPTPETFRIVSVAGTQVTLDHPAVIQHPASRDASGVLERFAPVANLTRSLVIRSANPVGTRGHLMITMGATGFLRNVEIRDMGRTTNELLSATNVKGRYAAHLHFVGSRGFDFSGNAINAALKWGITIHHTNGEVVSNNVVFDAWGAGVMTEDGTETDNHFDRNLVVGIRGHGGDADLREGLGEFGTSGDGFWFQGPLNRVTNNVAADVPKVGFLLWGRDNVNQALKEFRDNEAVATGIGLSVWYVGSADADSVVDHFYEWHSAAYGFYMYPSTRLILTDWYGRGDPRAMSPDRSNYGGWWGDYTALGTAMLRPDIQHKPVGVMVPYGNASSGDTTSVRVFHIDGGSFTHNVYGVVTRTPTGSYPPTSQAPFHTVLRGVHFAQNVEGDIRRWYQLSESANLLSLDRFDVIDHQGSPGDNFSLFYLQSAPDFVMPAGKWLGSAFAGLTNAQIWAQSHQAFAGAVATCSTTRPGIVGFVCPMTVVPQANPRETTARPPLPSAPHNVRIVQK